MRNKLAVLFLGFAGMALGQGITPGGGGGGGGTGTVTSITMAGTAGQITVTGTCTVTTTGTCTFSVPSAFVLPGTINGLTLTTSTGTLTIANLKTFAVNKSLTLDGTDGVTITFPTTNAVMARTDAAQTFTGVQTFSSPIVGTITGGVISAASLTSLGAMVGAGGQAAQTSSQLTVANLGTPGTEAWTLTNTSLGATPAGGHVLANTTAAAAGVQQVSPPMTWTGQGWKTNATAGSQTVAFQAYVLPVQGAANPTGTWILQSNVNNAGYATVLGVNSNAGNTVPGIFAGPANASGTGFTSGQFSFSIIANSTLSVAIQPGFVSIPSGSQYGFGASGAGTNDAMLTRFAAATIQHGAADAAAPVAQTIRMQSVVAGTSNTAGVNATIQGSAGTGTGVGGDILLKVAPAGTTGTAQNTAVTALTISGTYGIPVAGSVLFANLPAATNGGFIYCSDCTIAATCAGAGTGAFAKRLNSAWVCN